MDVDNEDLQEAMGPTAVSNEPPEYIVPNAAASAPNMVPSPVASAPSPPAVVPIQVASMGPTGAPSEPPEFVMPIAAASSLAMEPATVPSEAAPLLSMSHKATSPPTVVMPPAMSPSSTLSLSTFDPDVASIGLQQCVHSEFQTAETAIDELRKTVDRMPPNDAEMRDAASCAPKRAHDCIETEQQKCVAVFSYFLQKFIHEGEKTPGIHFPLSNVLVEADNVSLKVHSSWFESFVAPVIWECIDAFYTEKKVPKETSAFYYHFPSKDCEQIEEFIKLVEFIDTGKGNKVVSLNDIYAVLENFCTNKQQNIALNVVFSGSDDESKNFLEECIDYDFGFANTAEYLQDDGDSIDPDI